MSHPLPAVHPAVPWVESPFFDTLLPHRGLSPEDEARARFLHENGYLLLESHFDPALLDRARAEVEPLFASEASDPRRSGHRFQDAWKESPAVAEIAGDRAILDLLAALYGRRPVPFQTLNFSHGSEQRPHSDRIHFDSVPERFMVGVWVALEDVGPQNGTLCYYPGSHRLPHYDFDDLQLRLLNHNRLDPLEAETYADYDRYEDFVEARMAAAGLERVELTAPKGSVLIWSAGLVHGGTPVRQVGATRWSQVTHCYFEDCLYYVPIYSNRAIGDLYLKKVTDILTGEPQRQVYRGIELPEIPSDGVYKLMLDREVADDAGDEIDVVRLVSNRHIKHLRDDNEHLRTVDNANLRRAQKNLEAAIRDIEASLSFRLGRAVTAPLRWLRRLAGGARG